jgi:antitoxin (DNA-binding transcriptional repressor) of toxin-antitoxin stability system
LEAGVTKMGIKEFRERLTEVAHGTELISVTNHGRIVGFFTPLRRDPERAREAVAEIGRAQDELRARGVDLEAILRDMGLDAWGEPLVD